MNLFAQASDACFSAADVIKIAGALAAVFGPGLGLVFKYFIDSLKQYQSQDERKVVALERLVDLTQNKAQR